MSSILYAIKKQQSSSGRPAFTLVELLIVIVVIAILATIASVAYNGVQARSRDTERLQDMQSIVKALELYKLETGNYPLAIGSVGAFGWEMTADQDNTPTDFLSVLRTSRVMSSVPMDKRNDGSGNMDPSNNSERWRYFYHRYAAGSSGCPFERGDFYVLGITRMETVERGGIHPASPGFSCSGQNWGATRGAWVTGAYLQ